MYQLFYNILRFRLASLVIQNKSSKELYDKCAQEHAKVELITLNSSVHDLSDISKDDITSMSEGLLKFVIFNSPL